MRDDLRHIGGWLEARSPRPRYLPTYVVANFKETQRARIQPGDPDVTVDALGDQTLHGVVAPPASACRSRSSGGRASDTTAYTPGCRRRSWFTSRADVARALPPLHGRYSQKNCLVAVTVPVLNTLLWFVESNTPWSLLNMGSPLAHGAPVDDFAFGTLPDGRAYFVMECRGRRWKRVSRAGRCRSPRPP